MIRLMIFMAASVAIVVGCKRIGWDPGTPEPQDGMSGAQYNWWLIAGYAWPIALGVIKRIPGFGAPAGMIAEGLWAIAATKKQKDAEKTGV